MGKKSREGELLKESYREEEGRGRERSCGRWGDGQAQGGDNVFEVTKQTIYRLPFGLCCRLILSTINGVFMGKQRILVTFSHPAHWK